MDRTFADLAENEFSESPRTWALALDVYETEEAFNLTASVPGIDPDAVEITLNDNVLAIRGEIQRVQDIDESQWHLRERRYGSFQRSITLPTAVDAENIEAIYEDGVLSLNVPKVAEVKPKRIAINAN